VFVAMSKESIPCVWNDSSENFGITLKTDARDLDFAALLQSNFYSEIEDHVQTLYEKAAGLNFAGGEPDPAQLRAAILLPSDENIQACEFLTALPNFRELLRTWSHSLRLQTAEALTSDWIGEYREDLGEPIVLTSGSGGHSMSLVLRPQYVGTSLQRWDLSAVLVSKSESTGTWNVDAALTGDYVVPCLEGRYSSLDDVRMYLDDIGDEELYEVWGLLETLYLPRAGYLNYGDWVNDDGGCALANVTFWTPPGTDVPTMSTILFDAFVAAFTEGNSTWDASWREWVRPQDADGGEVPDEDDAEASLPPIGVVFVAAYGTGVLGHSIWDPEAEHATGQLVQLNGRRIGRQPRMSRQPRVTTKQEELGWAHLKSVRVVDADFVFYDPLAPSASVED
jgi:hypothetical protein